MLTLHIVVEHDMVEFVVLIARGHEPHLLGQIGNFLEKDAFGDTARL